MLEPSAPFENHGPILVVDDDHNDAMLVELAFAKAGCNDRIVHVWNGKGALQYLLGVAPFENRVQYPFPRLVLLDLEMPLMDGWGLLSHIRQISRWNNLPVIVLTGSPDPSAAKRARDQGANSFLTKPPDLSGYVDIARKLTSDVLQTPTPSAQQVPA
jgi:CheY-like chemotaxis protein